MDFFTHLFDSTGFPPRWQCGEWAPAHGWLHITADLLIFSAYFTIPFVLWYFARRRPDWPFRQLLWLFGAFILACSTTHLMEAVIFWWPGYRLAGLLKAVTAVISWVTLATLIPVLPKALSMRTPEELGREVAARRAVEAELVATNAALEERVRERTEQLTRSNASLQESQERLRLAVEVAGLGVMRIDYPAGTADLSLLAAELFDLPAGVPVARGDVHGRFHPDDNAELESRIARCLDPTGDGWFALEHRVVRADGSSRWLSVRKRVFFDAGGPSRAVLVAADITDRKLAEEQLAATNGRLNALLNALPVGVSFSEDTTCEHVTGNPAVQAQFAVRATDNLSASAADPVAPGRQVQFYQAGRAIADSELPLQRAVAENRVIPTMELEVVLPDGRQWFAEASGAPIHDERGTVIAGVAVTVDVTDRKLAETRLRESEERLRLTLESGAMGTFEVDLQSGEGIWNRVEFELLGLSPGDARACPETFFRYVHPEDLVTLNQQWEIGMRTGKFDAEFRVVRADGQVRWLAGAGSFLPAGVRTGTSGDEFRPRFLGVNYDITGRKLAEQQARTLNAELEERVAKRTAQLADANKELEAFSYSVSHDLRAPLRAVDGFARILLEDFAAHLPAEAQDYLREVCANAKQMGQLIDDLLAFSRLTRQNLQTAVVSVDTLVRQCVSDLSRGGPAEFRIVPELPSCLADPALLKQVWVNLIDNALKYSRFREPPVIEIGASTGDVETVYFVKDNGVGFDMRYAHKLFGVFQRLHRQEDFEGTGVGLAIVQRVIHRHGGRVWADAHVDQGATFFFSLPIQGSSHDRSD